ncbi:MAG: chorismate mutase [Pseudomonadota bacterium]
MASEAARNEPIGTVPAGGPDAVADTAPEDCAQMSEVRAEIDRIDRLLVALIAERTRYIEAAARIKPAESDVRVPWRIEDVVEKVLVRAREEGLSERLAESVWRELIERSIEHEGIVWRAIRSD